MSTSEYAMLEAMENLLSLSLSLFVGLPVLD